MMPKDREVLMTIKITPTEVLSPKQELKQCLGQGVCVAFIFILSSQIITFSMFFKYTDPE